MQKKEYAKIRAENFDRVNTFADAISQAGRENQGIFSHRDALWNFDAAAMLAEFGQKDKVFGSVDTQHGNFHSSSGNEAGKHIKAVVVVFASGRKTYLFFILEGKNVISGWFRPQTSKEASATIFIFLGFEDRIGFRATL